MLHLAARAPYRRPPLSSNVRPSGNSAGPAQETRTRQLTASVDASAASPRLAANRTTPPTIGAASRRVQMLLSPWTPTPQIHLPRVVPARRVGASSQMSGVVVSQTDGTATPPASAQAGRSARRAPHAKRGGVFFAVVAPVASGHSRVPNWSLERTSTGKALGPRGGQAYHPPRGPSALPAASAQLKR
jgi:hypothetical protein